LTHTLAGAFPYLFHLAHGRHTEESLLYVGNVGGITIPHMIASARCVESCTEHQAARLRKPPVLHAA